MITVRVVHGENSGIVLLVLAAFVLLAWLAWLDRFLATVDRSKGA